MKLRVRAVKAGRGTIEIRQGGLRPDSSPFGLNTYPNLLVYGPTSQPVNGFTVSVGEDGALTLSGSGFTAGSGVCWKLDDTLFTANGTYRLSMDKTGVKDWYAGVFSGDPTQGKLSRINHIPANAYSAVITPLTTDVRNGLWFGFNRYSSGGADTVTPVTVKLMLQPNSRSDSWVKPAHVDAGGASL